MAQSTEMLPNGLQLLQDDRFFKLGQDSVLLSAFAKPRRNAKLLDLGCGTGALALLVWRPDLNIKPLTVAAALAAEPEASTAGSTGVRVSRAISRVDWRQLVASMPS